MSSKSSVPPIPNEPDKEAGAEPLDGPALLASRLISTSTPMAAASFAYANSPPLFPRVPQAQRVADCALVDGDIVDTNTGEILWQPAFEAPAAGEPENDPLDDGSSAASNDTTATAVVSEASQIDVVAAAPALIAAGDDSDRYSCQPELSIVHAQEAGCDDSDIQVVTTMVSGYGAAADALVARGRWAAAVRAVRAELASHERRRQHRDSARTSIALGRLHLALGEVRQALRWFDHAGECASRIDGPVRDGTGTGGARLIGEALRWLGVAALDDGELDRSERLLRSALAAAGPEAHRQQVFAIELSLARCLFWQGRAREVVLPSTLDPGGAGGFSDVNGPRAALQTSDWDVLRVQRWRCAARLALAAGDLSAAGDAIARACRVARGEDEDDVRMNGCGVERSIGVRERARREQIRRGGRPAPSKTGNRGSRSGSDVADGRSLSSDDVREARLASGLERIREALQAGCHLEAARLQLAIGDTNACDAHLRECMALSRTPARTLRVQLLQLARLRNDRRGDARRRFERISAALRQPQVPRLVRIQARYLVEPRSRRALELTTFLDRHGEAVLAGPINRQGGSPMLDAFQDVLRICHETPDDLIALSRVCSFVRDRLRAASVAIYGVPGAGSSADAAARDGAPGLETRLPEGGRRVQELQEQILERAFEKPGASAPATNVASPLTRLALSGSNRSLSPNLATRAIDSGLAIPPTYRADALDAAAPVRYAGAPIGAIVVRWIIDATFDHTFASSLLGAAAAVVAPQLRAALDVSAPPAAPAAMARARTLGLLGISESIEKLRETINRVASAPFHALVEGESGSGKELVARALHLHGPRRHRRFCAVNCAALTDELLEAELFGHTRGAFTGALTERVGLFEEADGGTLFLDEIGELSPRAQAKLLRVIQDGETRRIGENLPRRVDARIVAATNRSLRDEVTAGRFRADLLYRLDVIRIAVPPLRARPEDIPVLARAFWDDAIARIGGRATLDPDTLAVLARYHWPGNVRELQNAMMALAVHAPPRGRASPSLLPAAIRAVQGIGASGDGGPGEESGSSETGEHSAGAQHAGAERSLASLDTDDGETSPGAVKWPARTDVDDEPRADRSDTPTPASADAVGIAPGRSLEEAKRDVERRYVRAAIARGGGSPSRAARELGMSRQGLAKLIARLDMDREIRELTRGASRAP